MQVVDIEKTVREIKYQAIDGTLFKDEKECKKYEKSAFCVINNKF